MGSLDSAAYRLCLFMLAFCLLLFPSVQSATFTVCGSGCNSTTIQNAIDLAGSGDMVSVAAGNYTENLLINKSVFLHGVGFEAAVIIGQEKIRVSNVTFDGFTVVGTVIVDDSVVPISGGMIFNNTVTGNSYGIRVGYTAGGNGISHVSIIGNQIVANTNKGILFYDAGDYAAQHVSYITVSGNVIANNSGSGISTYGTGHNAIINNVVSGNAGNGISIKYDDGDYVAGNIVRDNTAMGVNVHQVTNSTIENNTVTGHMSMSVVTTFWGTTIVAGKGSAIYIHEVSEGNVIRLNEFANNRIGILVSKESNNTAPAGNSIYSNKVLNNSESGIVNALVSSYVVDATDNWWGSAILNLSALVNGSADVYPNCVVADCSTSLATLYTGTGTTNFTAVTDWDAVSLVLDNSAGKIAWNSTVNLSASNMRFDDYVTVAYRKIGVSSSMPELNGRAQLTFRNTGFTNLVDFILTKDGVACVAPACTNLTMVNGDDVLVNVTGFSDYELVGGAIYGNLEAAGSGLGGFLNALTSPLVSIVLSLGLIGGLLAVFYGIASAFRRALGGAVSGIGS